MTYDEAKQIVERDTPIPNGWSGKIWTADMYAEAAELYARNLANEKVREDRGKIWHSLNPRFESAWDKSGFVYMSQIIDVHDNSPLPFPDSK